MNKQEAANSLHEKTYSYIESIISEIDTLKKGREFQNIATIIMRSFPDMTTNIQRILKGEDYREEVIVKSHKDRKRENVLPSSGQSVNPKSATCDGCPPDNSISSDVSHVHPNLANAIPRIIKLTGNEPKADVSTNNDKVDIKLLYTSAEVLAVAQSQANSQHMELRGRLVMLHELITGKKPHHLTKSETIAEKIAEWNVESKGKSRLI